MACGPRATGHEPRVARYEIRATSDEKAVAFRAGNGRIAGGSGGPGDAVFAGEKGLWKKSEEFFHFSLDRGLTPSDLRVEYQDYWWTGNLD